MKKYRLHCNTDNKNEFVISDSVPSDCPIDAGHLIDSSSVCIVDNDVLVNDGTPKNLPLSDYKQLRYNEIDGKTMSLIFGQGFTFDSHQFSLSIPAQGNWTNIKTNISDFTFPLDVTTVDNNTYSLSETDVVAFWTAGRDAVKTNMDSGRVLKKSVYDATTSAQVDAVVDNR